MKKEIKIQVEEKEKAKEPETNEPENDIEKDTVDKEKEPEPEPEPVDPVLELTDRLQRLAAEFENYKKRNAREFERGRQSGMVYIIERLLSTLDAFDSAMENFKGKDDTGIYEGFGKISQLMLDSLKGAGLEILVPEPGTPFNPHIHEVMLTLETDEFADQEIVMTLQKGYRFKNELIRAAKVQIAVEPKEKDA